MKKLKNQAQAFATKYVSEAFSQEKSPQGKKKVILKASVHLFCSF